MLLRRLDFFMCSNSLRNNVLKTDVFASIDSDHSPVILKIGDDENDSRGPSFWRFPAILTKDLEYVNEVKLLIRDTENSLAEASHQFIWEFVKYKIREFTIEYSKKKAKLRKIRKSELEKIIQK